MSIFDQTGQKVGIQINIDDDDSEGPTLHRLVNRQSGKVIFTSIAITVDKAYIDNKHFLHESLPYRWEIVE